MSLETDFERGRLERLATFEGLNVNLEDAARDAGWEQLQHGWHDSGGHFHTDLMASLDQLIENYLTSLEESDNDGRH